MTIKRCKDCPFYEECLHAGVASRKCPVLKRLAHDGFIRQKRPRTFLSDPLYTPDNSEYVALSTDDPEQAMLIREFMSSLTHAETLLIPLLIGDETKQESRKHFDNKEDWQNAMSNLMERIDKWQKE